MTVLPSSPAGMVDAPAARRSRLRRPHTPEGWFLLLLPTCGFLFVFFLYPLLFVVQRSLPDGSFQNYARIARTTLYARVILSTFQTAAYVTVICLVLGYAYAYALTRSRGLVLAILSTALLLPFWVSVLLRTFAWLVLLQDSGLVNRALLSLGLIQHPVSLIRNQFGVVLGMTHILLPYMVLPLCAVMRAVNPNLMAAARISGASPLRCFFRVYLPMTMPGVLAGCVLTVTLSLGFYITPAVLGGSRDAMIAQLIADQINQQVNFAFSSALAVTLILFSLVTVAGFGLLTAAARRRVGAS